MYRGSASPSLYGKYIYTDFCHGEIHALSPDGAGGWTPEQLTESNGLGAASFGVDMNGELWLAYTTTGVIYRLEDPASTETVQLDVKFFLEGPLNSNEGLMSDALRSMGLLPLQEPYTSLGSTQAAGGGGETTTTGVLATTGSNAVVDWVRLELRDAMTPTEIVATRQALLLRNGDVVMPDGSSLVSFNIPSGSYYVAVDHRNHLAVMSSDPIDLTSSPTTLDLRSPATSTYGSNARKTMGTWEALWAGDVTSDGVVKYVGNGNDRDVILTNIGGVSPTNTITGYHRSDVNMDGIVRYTGTSNDRDYILTNIGGVIPTLTREAQIPPL